MRRYLRPLGLVLVCLLLAAAGYAAASGDSLVSLGYLQKTFFPQAVQAGEEAGNRLLQDTYNKAKAELDAVHGAAGAAGGTGSYSDTLGERVWTDGQTISLPTGSSFVMLAGSAAVTHGGAVVDVTDGTETASGAGLSVNHRYVVGENTDAAVTIRSGEALLGVQGAYTLSAGKEKHTPFYDVRQGDWYYEPVSFVYERGLFSGMSTHQFAPGLTMNRAMLMSVLHRLAGAPEAVNAPSFTDVPDGRWYTQAVRWGAAQGITSGAGAGTFNPGGNITREQAVVMMYNYAVKYLGMEFGAGADLSRFPDRGQVSGWAETAMGWAVENGVIGGVRNGSTLTLEPRRSATRAEMATMLRSFCEKILKD